MTVPPAKIKSRPRFFTLFFPVRCDGFELRARPRIDCAPRQLTKGPLTRRPRKKNLRLVFGSRERFVVKKGIDSDSDDGVYESESERERDFVCEFPTLVQCSIAGPVSQKKSAGIINGTHIR